MGEVVESGDRRKRGAACGVRREEKETGVAPQASSLKPQVSDSAGFTLFELMVVLSIFIFLLGLGVTVISKLSYRWGFEANIMRAQAIIRAARNFSLTNETFSEVHIIPLGNRIFALGEKTVAQWHFEEIIGDEVTGAYGINGKVSNAVLVQGRTGQGLEFGTGDGLGVRDSYVDCGNLPVFNPPAGIVFDMWVFPGDFRSDTYKQLIGKLDEEDDEDEEPLDEEALEEEARRRAQNEITLKHKFDNEQRFSIIFKEGSYFLSLTENYALEFGFAVPANYFPLRTLDNVVTPNMWNHIELRYSGIIEYPPDKVRLFVNGVPITIFYIHARGSIYTLKRIADIPVDYRAQMLPAQLPETDSSLYISDVEESFYGVIDDVRIAAMVDPEIEKLDSAFLMGYPQIIYFDPQGRLDPERHEGDVMVKLTENPRYKAPVPESEKPDFTSRSGGMSGPISTEEALADLERKQNMPPELHKHAIVTINKYGKMKLDQVVEEEKKEEE